MTTRVRFAPSPTGNLHIGGARTALFNWLFARSTGGRFLLRIEDTDGERSTDASRDAIFEALDWLGLDHDEEAVIQSARRELHVEAARSLLDRGLAYRCFATADDIAEMKERAFAQGRTRIYERTWRERDDAPDGRPYTVRLKMPLDGETTLHDAVLGDINVANDDLDDYIILRSDGSPTYNFVVVCDDAAMQITDVIRGQDHVSNTFRQLNTYRALGLETPRFAHLPLVDGLSKRKGSVSVQHYRDSGYIADAVNNYIARLGWSHGDQEIFTREELIASFSLAGVNAGSGRYDDEKFAWVNSQWIRRLDVEDVADRLLPFLARLGLVVERDDRLLTLVRALQPRAGTLVEMAEMARFAYERPTTYDDKAVAKWIRAAVRPAFQAAHSALADITSFDESAINAAIETVLADHGIGMGKLAQPLRIALTGTAVSPPIDVTLIAVGQAEALARMEAAEALFESAT